MQGGARKPPGGSTHPPRGPSPLKVGVIAALLLDYPEQDYGSNW